MKRLYTLLSYLHEHLAVEAGFVNIFSDDGDL